MSLQFEHNSFFRNKLKEQKTMMEYINKELDDMSKEFYGLKSQISHLEILIAEVSDKQATLVNKMATKPENFHDNKSRYYYILKIFSFSLKGDAKTWYNSLAPGCVSSPQDMIYYFSTKYFPTHNKQAALQEIYNFVQIEEESLPQAWGRLLRLVNALCRCQNRRISGRGSRTVRLGGW